MKVITIEDKAFSRLMENLEALTKEIRNSNQKQKPPKPKPKPKPKLPGSLNEIWLDNQEVCEILKVTKRTLQRYKEEFKIPYVQLGRRTLFKASDVRKLLDENYVNIDEE